MKKVTIRAMISAGAFALVAIASPSLAQAHKAPIAETVVEDAKAQDKVRRENVKVERTEKNNEISRMRDVLRLDANGDGLISEKELVEYELLRARKIIEKQVAMRFADLDVDGDGQLSAAEIAIGGPVLMGPIFSTNIDAGPSKPFGVAPMKPECRKKMANPECSGIKRHFRGSEAAPHHKPEIKHGGGK